MKRPKRYKSPIVKIIPDEEWERIKNEQKESSIKKTEEQSKRVRELHKARNEEKPIRVDKGRVIRRPSRTVVS